MNFNIIYLHLELKMTIKRYGVEGGTGMPGVDNIYYLHVQRKRQVSLYVSGQTPMTDGEVVEGGIVNRLA